jgi:thiol-disulfide isomerase/thioredoxin
MRQSTPVTPSETAPSPPPPLAPIAPRPARRFPWSLLVGLVGGLALPLVILLAVSGPNQANPPADKDTKAHRGATTQPDPPPPDERPKIPAPDLDGGIAWLNTAGPLSIKKDLKGKVVLLDFWTLCCINCIHVIPDLTRLERKYPNELVVIGVHSPKFDNEKDTNSIRKAILRYQIEHPVVNDAEHKIWNRYGVEAWPTMVLIDPEGNILGEISGEGNFEILDKVIAKVIDEHKKKKTLDETPLRFDLARFRESGDTPLFFPGKVVADEAGDRLFIADSTHHRIVITDLNGRLRAVAGTGNPGQADGPFDKAEFHDPQGMAVRGDTLYVADRKNHTLRELNLKDRTVRTIAGTGQQENDAANRRLDRPVPARSIGLNSPWDLYLHGDQLYIAMAGHHQIWVYDLKKKDIGPYAGTGHEKLGDGPLAFAHFAQPSGLTGDGQNLYVADSEVSALRRVPLNRLGRVRTLVGRGLFVFGDQDGPGQDGGEDSKTEARLQHALGVVHVDGKLYIADTYNSKVKEFDLATGILKTFVGGGGDWGWLSPPVFNEPAGISYAAGKLYVADTNAHRIRVIDLATKAVSTLPLQGAEPPLALRRPEPRPEPKK